MITYSAGIKFKRSSVSSPQTSNNYSSPSDSKKSSPISNSSISFKSYFPQAATESSQNIFKIISFDSKASSPKHRRQPSMIIKDVRQVYNFANEKNSSSEEISDEECISGFSYQKNSIFASTTDRRSSAFNSVLKRSPEEKIGRFEISEIPEINEGLTKIDENFTTLGYTHDEGRETPLGILPKNLFCAQCKLNTTTVVDIKLPTLPFWKSFCCLSVVPDNCYDLETLEKYQEFQHKCRNCGKLLASSQPDT